jgi:hypothetical protein
VVSLILLMVVLFCTELYVLVVLLMLRELGC